MPPASAPSLSAVAASLGRAPVPRWRHGLGAAPVPVLAVGPGGRRRRHVSAFQEAPPPPPPPPPPAASGLAALASRRLVYVSGRDGAAFLQGLVTANLLAAGGLPRRDPVLAAFLTAKGRVRHDSFVYPLARGLGSDDDADGGFLVEVDADFGRLMLEHLQRHNLHARIGLRELGPDEASVWQAWDDGALPDSGCAIGPPGSAGTDADRIGVRDPRAPGLGWRIVQLGGKAPELTLERRGESDYTIRRYLAGVPEGMCEFAGDQSLPLEYNLDLMGAIDFRKGCYVGQELTIRTKHRGSVRKRVLPCVIYGDDQPTPSSLVYRPPPPASDARMTADMVPGETPITHLHQGQSAGRWLRGLGNIGLALCRLGLMTDLPVPGEAPGHHPADECVLRWSYMHMKPTLKIKAFPPQWLTKAMAHKPQA